MSTSNSRGVIHALKWTQVYTDRVLINVQWLFTECDQLDLELSRQMKLEIAAIEKAAKVVRRKVTAERTRLIAGRKLLSMAEYQAMLDNGLSKSDLDKLYYTE